MTAGPGYPDAAAFMHRVAQAGVGQVVRADENASLSVSILWAIFDDRGARLKSTTIVQWITCLQQPSIGCGRVAIVSETHAHALPPGFRIDEYEIVRVLGKGGFGITYLAFDRNLDGPVAIKEYFPDIAARTAGRRVTAASTQKQQEYTWGLDRFLKEARAIHRLRHPSIVRVHRYVERHGTAYIVMEYVEGDSLATILKSGERLLADEWRPWLDRLLDGLAHVHDQGYLHRDIKPANIVIRAADGEPVLIDFGSARLASHQRPHTQVLTPGYAPFEQHTSQGVQGPPTDIYALAAVSFHVLAGTPPPTATDRMVNDRYEPLAGRVAGARPEWLATIDHALAMRPEDRPQTVPAWRETLHETSRMDATEIEELLEAASHGDGHALARLRVDADAGNSKAQFALGEAQFALGEMYEYDYENEHGELVPADYAAAVAWYHKAADQGHAVAQFRLGILYRKGVPVHEEAAAAWYRKAADQGLAGAQCELGRMYEDGKGVPPDEEEEEEVHAKLAVTWYRRAADQGYPEAQYNLGRMYASGRGDSVLEDAEEAVAWFQKAASRGHVEAQFQLGHMHSLGRGVPEDAKEAVTWYRKAASQGHPGAHHYLGEMYDKGWGMPKDAAEAVACYRKAARSGDGVYSLAAQLALGNIYRAGNSVPTDAAAAVAWYRKAADKGNLAARFALGEMYARGEGVMRNAEAAVTWFRRAHTIDQTVPVPLEVGPWIASRREKADEGDARAQFDLGWMCHHGKGVAADAATAAAWYRKAADQGDPRAQFNLGVMYTLREGVPRDLIVAHMWFDVASASAAKGRRTLFDGDLYGSALAAMEAIEGDMTASEIAEATRRAVTRMLQDLDKIMKLDANQSNIRSGFTDEQYKQAQPLFTAAWVQWSRRWPGSDVDFIEYLATYLTENHGLPVEAACDMADRFHRGQCA